MAFTIATVTLGGAVRLGICPMPGRQGDGLADLAAIARWDPALVVSATDTAEMARYNMEDLGALLARAGIDWVHYPIRDFGAPRGGGDWAAVSERAHAALGAGGVIAHCHGGQGRSGMILLRLMAERGEEPEAALGRLRAVRPGAVETDAQFAWAAAGFRG